MPLLHQLQRNSVFRKRLIQTLWTTSYNAILCFAQEVLLKAVAPPETTQFCAKHKCNWKLLQHQCERNFVFRTNNLIESPCSTSGNAILCFAQEVLLKVVALPVTTQFCFSQTIVIECRCSNSENAILCIAQHVKLNAVAPTGTTQFCASNNNCNSKLLQHKWQRNSVFLTTSVMESRCATSDNEYLCFARQV